MKRFEKLKSSRLLLFGIFVGGMMTLASCLKDDEQGSYQISAVRALNAVPGSASLDIGLDGKQLNFDNASGEDEDFAFGDTLAYKNAWPGNRWVTVFNPADYPNAEPLAQGTVYFTPGRFYSLYVVGYDEDTELMATEDNLSAPGAGKAKIRFINLSPNAPSLDFRVDDADTLIASNKAFKEVADFSAIDAEETYIFNIIEHSSGNVVHTFEFTPKQDMIYTIWVKGLFENTGDDALDFGHDIITH
ncbi:DUF4397 domain-containing protein [Parapedobacter koreensis]|uniref:DUF4397 domain-containing protein n=1 Tax=Parapedobacter koreensis TaxID=332977 RepID=A0A1H7G4U5_9SPHI|nr:DUF4397 domain-containing protein [Parapedobacter koreensis]SEK33094.1 protein of unknown function [Parapedobacter koreensis]